ncbi:MAG: sulfite exporter TauE/SafE family protein [Chitinophagaceae bacterium]|nr:sulfite exporter TauE/SafE family protein [Chitinophagaceae bacterium]MCW5929540.1 sulfite exporter TauE/SafE family protein [Chitinophagaceae bacterium]
MWVIITGGFMLGFLGSLHCIGMCGPLALALPVHHMSPAKKAASILLYQAGRVFSYTLLGLVFGMAGKLVYLGGWQQSFSVGLGTLILFLLGYYYFSRRNIQPAFMRKINGGVQRWVVHILQSPKRYSFLLLGMANGLLPCGMVYMAMAAALTSSVIGNSMLFMAMFGVGTMPAMISVCYFGATASITLRRKVQHATPFIMAFTAVILILRGLNLGIPFISPLLPASPGDAMHCAH